MVCETVSVHLQGQRINESHRDATAPNKRYFKAAFYRTDTVCPQLTDLRASLRIADQL